MRAARRRRRRLDPCGGRGVLALERTALGLLQARLDPVEDGTENGQAAKRRVGVKGDGEVGAAIDTGGERELGRLRSI